MWKSPISSWWCETDIWLVVISNTYCKSISYFQNVHTNLTLDDLHRGYFKVTKVKIVCGVSPVRVGYLAIGHLNDLDLQEDWFGAMRRPCQKQLDFLFTSALINVSKLLSRPYIIDSITELKLCIILGSWQLRTDSKCSVQHFIFSPFNSFHWPKITKNAGAADVFLYRYA